MGRGGFELGGKIESALLLLSRVFLNQRLFDLCERIQMLLIYGFFLSRSVVKSTTFGFFFSLLQTNI